MPNISRSAEFPVSAERGWDFITDFNRFPDWLTIHSRWPAPPPTEIAEGITVQHEVRLMGMPAVVTWTLTEFDKPTDDKPSVCELSGEGPMGIALRVRFDVEPVGDGMKVTLTADFSGGPLAGPIGTAVGKNAADELEKSLQKAAALLS